MPIFTNILPDSDLILPGEDGLSPDLRVAPGETFHGSESFYRRYSGRPEFLIERSTDGYVDGEASTLTGPDRIFVDVEGFIRPDLITASDDDDSNNSTVTSGSVYTAFGKIRWKDSVTTGLEHEADFSITGLGDHGASNEATFSIGSTSPGGSAQSPTAAGSRLDISGSITFAMSGAGATFPEVEVVYEMSKQGYRLGDTNPLLTQPNFSTSFEYVVAGDINNETYVTGSTGEIKTEKVFSTGASVGDPARTTTYYYQNTSSPTDVTHKVEEKSFVTSVDLP